MLWLAIFKVHKIPDSWQASQRVLVRGHAIPDAFRGRCPARYSYFPTATSIRGADCASFALPRLKTDIFKNHLFQAWMNYCQTPLRLGTQHELT